MANFFKARREELGKSQFELAVRVGKTTNTIRLWEKGSLPKLREAQTLAQAYEVPVETIIEAIVEMSQRPTTAAAE